MKHKTLTLGIVTYAFMLFGFQLVAVENNTARMDDENNTSALIARGDVQEKEVYLKQGRLRVDNTPSLSKKEQQDKYKNKRIQQGRLGSHEYYHESDKKPYKAKSATKRNEKDKSPSSSYDASKKRPYNDDHPLLKNQKDSSPDNPKTSSKKPYNETYRLNQQDKSPDNRTSDKRGPRGPTM